MVWKLLILVDYVLASLALRQEAMKEAVYFVLHKYILCELLAEWVVYLPDWKGIASDD